MTNKEVFERKKELIPGGVNSPVRAFQSVGGNPLIIEKADGPFLYDIEGNKYIDFLSSWGPAILGHNNQSIKTALEEQISKGIGYGTPVYSELELAEMITESFPSIDMVRMVNSGTEATMTAIRLARAFTGKNKFIKIQGGYHGHSDPFLVSAGSGMATLGVPASPGVTPATVHDTLTVPFNNISALEEVIRGNKNEIAAFILEPVPGNMGVIIPEEGYLERVRELTKDHDILLIFDEVISGFRLSLAGAQGTFHIEPDLTTLGKIIGGGLPVGAIGGRKDIMLNLSPVGNVYQAGTLSGNPVAMAAGKAVLSVLKTPGFYEQLNLKSDKFFSQLKDLVQDLPIQVNSIGSMGTLFFNENPVKDFNSSAASDGKMYARFFHSMLEKGYYFAPSGFECMFISNAQDNNMLDAALSSIEKTLKELGY